MIHAEYDGKRLKGTVEGTGENLLYELMSIIKALKDTGMTDEMITVAVATGVSKISEEFLKDEKELS